MLDPRNQFTEWMKKITSICQNWDGPPPQQPILSFMFLFPGSPWSSRKTWFAWTSWKEGMTLTLLYFYAKYLFYVLNYCIQHCDILKQMCKKVSAKISYYFSIQRATQTAFSMISLIIKPSHCGIFFTCFK